MFSATFPLKVTELAYEHMNDAETIRIDEDHKTTERVSQVVYYPSNREKLPLLIKLLREMVDGHVIVFVNTRRAADLVRQLPQTITQQQLDSVAALLGDPARDIYVRGGRISDTLARFLSAHLRQIRPGIHHLADDPELWPDTVLRMRRRDVAVLFDFRRYQPSLERLATTISQQRRAQVVLITDKWQSPAARYCSHVIALPIEIGTAWDTGAAALALIEALVVTVSEQDWHSTEDRIKDWDVLRARLEGKNTSKNEESQ
jgi:DNA-binding MurR/RpiR family transcriptional regulator